MYIWWKILCKQGNTIPQIRNDAQDLFQAAQIDLDVLLIPLKKTVV